MQQLDFFEIVIFNFCFSVFTINFPVGAYINYLSAKVLSLLYNYAIPQIEKGFLRTFSSESVFRLLITKQHTANAKVSQ
jgi:hypothetical protein